MTQIKNMNNASGNNTGEQKTFKNTGEQRTSKYAALQFYRTAICNDFMLYGKCPRGDKCTFAHGEDNLCSRPVLSKTKMCPHRYCNQRGCGYAHLRKELVSTGSFWKTSMCRFAQQCKIKATCRFAHSEEELRSKKYNGEKVDPDCEKKMMEQMERKCGSNFSESHRSRRTSYNRMTVTAKNVTFVQTAGQSVEEDNASQDFDVRSVGELQSIFATSRDSEVDNTSSTRLARLPSSYSATPELPRDQDALMDRVSSFYPTTVPWWSVTEGDLSAALPTHYED